MLNKKYVMMIRNIGIPLRRVTQKFLSSMVFINMHADDDHLVSSSHMSIYRTHTFFLYFIFKTDGKLKFL